MSEFAGGFGRCDSGFIHSARPTDSEAPNRHPGPVERWSADVKPTDDGFETVGTPPVCPEHPAQRAPGEHDDHRRPQQPAADDGAGRHGPADGDVPRGAVGLVADADQQPVQLADHQAAARVADPAPAAGPRGRRHATQRHHNIGRRATAPGSSLGSSDLLLAQCFQRQLQLLWSRSSRSSL